MPEVTGGTGLPPWLSMPAQTDQGLGIARAATRGTAGAGATVRTVLLAGVLLAAILLPRFVDHYVLRTAILLVYSAYLGQSWNIVGGYAGQFSFGHATFFGIGAYTTAVLFIQWGISPWIGMWVGAALAAAAGVFLGSLCFRYGLKGPYFSLATLAFAEIARIVALNWDFIGGPRGRLLPLRESFWNYQFPDETTYYYVILAMLVGVTALTAWLARTRWGMYFQALREDEDAAEALGVNTTRHKLLAMALSSAAIALGGTFYLQHMFYIDPDLAFGIDVSVAALLPAIVGGPGTVWGPLAGALVLTPLGEFTRSALGGYGGVHLMLYGAVLIVVIMLLPGGLLSLPERWRERSRRRQAPGAPGKEGKHGAA